MRCLELGRWRFWIFAVVALAGLASIGRAADEKAGEQTINLSNGKIQMTAPDTWLAKKPANNVIQFEFAIPAIKGDERDGRATIMGAGGSVEQNIDRWIGQFTQPDGSETKKVAKVEEKKIAGQEVHFVDISGTYKDQPGGPFAGGKSVDRPGYRMLGAIVVSKDLGSYFVKFYGPEKTVGENKPKFEKMIDSLKIK